MNYIFGTSEQYAGRLAEYLLHEKIIYRKIEIGAGYAFVLKYPPHHSVVVDLLRHMQYRPFVMVRTKKSASRAAELLEQEAKAFEKIMCEFL